MKNHTFTLGIEEEFAIIDPETRELRSHIHEILEGGKVTLKEQIKPEMHQSVVELGTEICDSIVCAREHVVALRTDRGAIHSIVVLPQCPKSLWWMLPLTDDLAMTALQAATKEFHGDSQRTYLVGMSMGGFGALRLGAKYPDRFRGISAHSSVTTLGRLAESTGDRLDAVPGFGRDMRRACVVQTTRHQACQRGGGCGADEAIQQYRNSLQPCGQCRAKYRGQLPTTDCHCRAQRVAQLRRVT